MFGCIGFRVGATYYPKVCALEMATCGNQGLPPMLDHHIHVKVASFGFFYKLPKPIWEGIPIRSAFGAWMAINCGHIPQIPTSEWGSLFANVDEEEKEHWSPKDVVVNKVFVRKTSLAHSRERWGKIYWTFFPLYIVQGMIYMCFWLQY